MKLSNWQKGVAAVLVAQVIWGIAGPLVKIGVTDIPPFSLLFLRCLLASLILFPFFERQLKKEPAMTWEDKKNIFLAGFIGVFVNIGLYFWGQQKTSVIDTWVIISSGTIFLVIYSYFAVRERLAKITYAGIFLAFIGTLVVIGTPILSVGRGGVFGNILILGSTIAASYSYLVIKDLMKKFSVVTVTYYSFLVSLPFALPFFLWEFWQKPGWIAGLNSTDWLIVAYLVLGSSIAAYVLDNFGLKFIPASIASTIGYASAVISIALSIIFLHEKLTPFFAAGAILVALGLFLAEMRHPNSPLHRLRKRW